MPLPWKEIRQRANLFVERWKSIKNIKEESEAQTFENEFFNIFGIDRKMVALFEHKVEINDNEGKKGSIDLFWKGNIIIEMKSPDKDLDEAFEQAKRYALNLSENEIPKGILTCDFFNFKYYDLEDNAKCYEFKLEELKDNVELFWYFLGEEKIKYHPVDPVNIKAAEMMGKLYDTMKSNKYAEHELEMYLVRIMFCLFADNTGIFDEKGLFYKFIKEKTKEDGTDLAMYLGLLFQVLDTPKEKRANSLDEIYDKFPYVNGGLFEKGLNIASFNSEMRSMLLTCTELDWSKIKPEIFGAMFQSVKDKEKRRLLGEHYTSEENILKLIKPLFLDELWKEFKNIKRLQINNRKQKLLDFHGKLQKLKFFDPACGCGNFLVVSYRELRLLEIEVIKEYLPIQQVLNIDLMMRVNVDQFYGIEIEEFPARIAQTALWLMDHLMNIEASNKFGKYIVRIPLTASPNIVIGNALGIDWETVIPKTELSYIMGNPPFLGSRIMDKKQKSEVEKIFNGIKFFGELDYVTCWYKKAAQYIQGANIEVAFVSTNSICQGLQVPVLWKDLIIKDNIKINFAHQTFKWNNEAKGKAAVYCVIVGLALFDRKNKYIFQYETVASNPVQTQVKQINAYLVDGENIFISTRTKPLCNVPEMNFGNMPADGGHLLLSDEEKGNLIKIEPKAKKYIKPLISAREFINGINRWCLWLVDIEPKELKNLNLVYERVKKVKEIRKVSARPHLADTPYLFAQITQPKGKDYILIPRVSSENRKYIPVGKFNKNHIASDSCQIIPDATMYHFGILTSTMHMAWTRYVCGRLKSDYRYSKDIVYNNFPWPNPTDKQKEKIEILAQDILDARAKFPDSTLADLYDPLTMPPLLLKAHQKLDKAVERAYGKTFNIDSERVAYLFGLYQNITEGLLFNNVKKKKRK